MLKTFPKKNPFILVFILIGFFCASPNPYKLKNRIDYSDFYTQNKKSIIIDCNYSLNESLSKISIPSDIKNNLRLVDVYYYSFDGNLHRGQIVIYKDLVNDIRKIFEVIRLNKFPVQIVIPVVHYNWSDIKSMEDNNSSAFNYRNVTGTKLRSAHSIGKAIDINPLLNPQIKHGKIIPQGASYNPLKPGTLTRTSIVVKEFLKLGWNWGGDWETTKDYQHFEKGFSNK